MGFPGGCGESRCEPSRVPPPKTQDAAPRKTWEAGGQMDRGASGHWRGTWLERQARGTPQMLSTSCPSPGGAVATKTGGRSLHPADAF